MCRAQMHTEQDVDAVVTSKLGSHGRLRTRMPALVLVLIGMSGGVALEGCKDLTGSQQLPAGTVNPAFYSTPAGAVGLRTQAIYILEQSLPHYITTVGLLTDELESNTTGISAAAALNAPLTSEIALDARQLPEEGYGITGATADADYAHLQIARADLSQALAAIAAHDTGAKQIGDPRHLRAELFALEGYTEILLADLFCSGVPLSTLDFNGDYTYHASLTMAQVYHDAIVQEDSALALADTSAQIQYLARVLKGRALLSLDSAAAAAQVVATVPDGFQYQRAVNFTLTRANGTAPPPQNQLNDDGNGTVADTEGHNGLPYMSSGDPRAAVTVTYPVGAVSLLSIGITNITNVIPLTFPSKYSYTGFSPFVVASGVEARLIEAEAALKGGSSNWLTTLNTLRTNGVFTPPDTLPPDTLGVTHCGGSYGLCGTFATRFTIAAGQPTGGYAPAGYSVASADTVYPAPAGIQSSCNANSWYEPCYGGDTMVVLHYVRPAGWGAGTGGVANLAPLSDPGTDSARVALLFRERAFWLFLTGERQGDLRRLLRQYSQWFRRQDHLYPAGNYTGQGTRTYGNDVTAPIPGAEDLNPLFHGCLDRNP